MAILETDKGPIAIMTLAHTTSQIAITGDQAFAEAFPEGLNLTGFSRVADQVEFQLRRDPNGPRPHWDGAVAHWVRSYNRQVIKPDLPHFGKTSVAGLRQLADGFAILMPQHCVPLIRRGVTRPLERPIAPVELSFADAVQRVNEEKRIRGQELALSINELGNLRAVLEFG